MVFESASQHLWNLNNHIKLQEKLLKQLAVPLPLLAPTPTPATSTATPSASDTTMIDACVPAALSDAGAGQTPGEARVVLAEVLPAITILLKRTTDARVAAEKIMLSLLLIFEQMSNARLVFSSPSCSVQLASVLPTSAGALATSQIVEPEKLLQFVQSAVVSAVLPAWSHPCLEGSPAIMNALVTILTCCTGMAGGCWSGFGCGSVTHSWEWEAGTSNARIMESVLAA